MRSLEQVNIRTNVRTYVRTYSHTYVRDRPYIPSTTLLCEGIINKPVKNKSFALFIPRFKIIASTTDSKPSNEHIKEQTDSSSVYQEHTTK